MSNQEYPYLFNKNDQLYHTVWLAAINFKEFQRLAKIENCEIELISIQKIW